MSAALLSPLLSASGGASAAPRPSHLAPLPAEHHGPAAGQRPAVRSADPGRVVGVYPGAGNAGAVGALAALLGHRVGWAMDFLDGSSWTTISDPGWFLGRWAGSGYKMVWGVPMLPNSGASLATGATGAYDHWFATLATALVNAGEGSSVIRLGWEFNGGWFPWAANHHAGQFVTYWRDLIATMRSVPGAHFLFEWNPTRGDLGVGPLSDYYPGNAYVDVIGLDVYDVEWGSYPRARAEWTHILTEPYGLDWLASFAAAAHKPVALPEWGLGWSGDGMVGGGDDAYFVRHMAAWIGAHDVENAIAWDFGSDPLPAKSAPASRRAFAAAFST